MATILEYKCPCCGGKVEFDSGTQQMKCPYCDSTFDVEAMREHDEALKTEEPDQFSWEVPQQSWQQDEDANINVYCCDSCGGQIVAEETTAATHCPFCGNPVVLTGRLAGDLKPDYVIPFQLDQASAKQALRKHFTGKRLLPKQFLEEQHLDEIKGVYVPFWLFDAEVNADIRYRATRTRHWSDSKYHYTETRYYAVKRSGKLCFDRVPVDGSSKMPDDLMESLEPFDFSKAVEFQTAYLSGYLADRYDVPAQESMPRANERVKESTQQTFAQTVTGFDTVLPEKTRLGVEHGRVKYALYPVWLLSSSWNGQRFQFAMNGQTGKLVGNLPMDKGAYWKWRLIYTALFAAICFVLLLLGSMVFGQEQRLFSSMPDVVSGGLMPTDFLL